MKKIDIDLKSIAAQARKNIPVVLWVFLLLVVLLEAWVIKGAIDMVLYARNSESLVQGQIVRVNFEQYDLIEKRLENNRVFTASEPTQGSPFGLKEAE